MIDKDSSQRLLQNMTTLPGVYQMLDNSDHILYVGKALNLKKRLSSYFRESGLSAKNKSLMQSVAKVQHIITNTEAEALILENNLIKKHHPKYNVLLRDDKSYPYIQLTKEKFARLKIYRGKRQNDSYFFGPFPSVQAVKDTIDILQKIFKIRNCSQSFFKNRSRPCIQYEIGRCTAPCVNHLIDKNTYNEQVSGAIQFLKGKSELLIEKLEYKMQNASDDLKFEEAANYRDQLQSLRKILQQQYISREDGDADVLVILKNEYATVIQTFNIRGGQAVGSSSHYPKIRKEHQLGEILQSFLEQTYLNNKPPKEIILNQKIPNESVLLSFFESQFSIKVQLLNSPRTHRAKWLELAKKNAQQSLQGIKLSKSKLSDQFDELKKALTIDKPINLMACVDVSHTMGEQTVASYVVFDRNGPKKSDYRKYNIQGIVKGDDYAALEQLINRRFKRILNDPDKERFPDILFIDGGKGQFNRAQKVIQELNISNMLIVGIAKGISRKPGMEKLFIGSTKQAKKISSDNPALHLIQQIRDESHRFAITGHRKKREKNSFYSIFENIEGIGNKRRQSLLKYFAGLKGIQSASIDELSQVNGISPNLAKKIYNHFHGHAE